MGLQFDLLNGYREYISVPLAIPMVAGGIYYLEFYDFSNRSVLLCCNLLPIADTFLNSFDQSEHGF